MSTKVVAAWKRYNANANNRNVGDCVKRALSFAYGRDYNDVSNELNRIKRDIGSTAFNNIRTWTKYLQEHGATKVPLDGASMTEETFSNNHPTGIYILLTGHESKGYATHMVCIMNGDIIDSWDSSKNIVYDIWKINNVHDDIVEDLSWRDIIDDVTIFIDDFLDKTNKKYSDWFAAQRDSDRSYAVNDLTYRMRFNVRTDKNLPDASSFYPDRIHSKVFVLKLNPRMSVEENIKSLQKKLKQSVYDWLYEYEKDYRDTKAVLNAEEGHFGKYKDHWSQKELLRLPPWVRSRVVSYSFDDSHHFEYDNYCVTFKALPDDPNVADRGDTVYLNEDTMRDLQNDLKAYVQDYARPGYDY